MPSPHYHRMNLPKEGWKEFRKKRTMTAVRIDGPFSVSTTEGVVTCLNGWLALDSRGYPYPIANDELRLSYEEVKDD